MINPDLTTWQVVADSDHGVDLMQVKPYGAKNSTFESQMYFVRIKPSTALEASGVYIWFGNLMDGAKLVPGNSYTVSFYLPCGTDVWKAMGEPEGGYKDNFYNNNRYLKTAWTDLNASLLVGISYGSNLDIDDGDVEVKTQLFEITYENVDDFFGKKLTASFVCPDYTGNAYLTFTFGGNAKTTNPWSFYFSDVSLIDPNDSSAELKGIKGLLHNFYWDLVGGQCDNEDCPHSNEDNPHVSIFVRLFVPSDGALNEFTNKIKDLFAEKLGFIYSAFDFMLQFLNKLKTLFSGGTFNGTFSFTLPSQSFDFLGYHIKLWDEITINMDWLKGTSGIGLLYSIYKMCLHAGFIIAIISYGDKIYKEVVSSA